VASDWPTGSGRAGLLQKKFQAMSDQKKALVLVNLGSPLSTKVSDVRTYLKEFLSDPYVIDLPSWFRYLLVHGIIAPIRAPRSARLYEKLHTERGFPLVYHSQDLENKVEEKLPSGIDLFLAMRYGQPSLKDLIGTLREKDYQEILVFPLYPQFASSTTGSVIKLLLNELGGNTLYDRTYLIPHIHRDKGFIELWQKKIAAFRPADYDAILFSYHGIPVRQTLTAHPDHSCEMLNCEQKYFEMNEYCYRASCFQTTRSIAGGLDIEADKVFTAFQSRFGRNWLSPFTDQTLLKLVSEGKRKILIVSPAFVADCLETTIEIAYEYKHLFSKAGGESLTLVPSLNSDDNWASFIASTVMQSPDKYTSLESWSGNQIISN
jgi:ferrochelatase